MIYIDKLYIKLNWYFKVLEEDSLPKIVCHECIKKLENFIEFRETVVSAEGMLESYFTSLRFSEDFLKEGKVYVKNTEKDRPVTPENEVLKSIEKVAPTTGNQIINNDQQIQHQQPVVVSNINTSNIQIISGVQARVQQYKCAMQVCYNNNNINNKYYKLYYFLFTLLLKFNFFIYYINYIKYIFI